MKKWKRILSKFDIKSYFGKPFDKTSLKSKILKPKYPYVTNPEI